jgi:uncharacterized membrane protein YGL010W
MIFTPQPPSPLVNNWIERHRDARSFVLHLFGIPCTILGVLLMPIYILLLSFTLFLFALTLFVGGFLIQFLGHGLDGTEPGEIKGIRIWMAKRRQTRLERDQIRGTLPELDRS